MSIIYNEKSQKDFIAIFNGFIASVGLNLKPFIKYGGKIEKIEGALIKKGLDNFLSKTKFTMGKTYCEDNNYKYPIFFNEENKQCAFLNIKKGGFGEIYIFVSDYLNNSVTNIYEINPLGISIK